MKRLIILVFALFFLAGCKNTDPGGVFEEAAITTETICTTETVPSERPQDASSLAAALSKKHGLTILAGTEAAETEPWDYAFLPETDEQILLTELSLLDRHLLNYPEGMLDVLSQDCGGIRICLVKEIRGKENTGSLDTAKGLQFRDEQGHCYLMLAQDREYTLYHELCHVIEDFVLPRSAAWDDWDQLNPDGFAYDYDLQKNAQRDESQYLTDGNRAFIDTYSMSFPQEDRARLMEYAMTPGNEALFSDPVMQRKLSLLTAGIREAFGLSDFNQVYRWEQYLNP